MVILNYTYIDISIYIYHVVKCYISMFFLGRKAQFPIETADQQTDDTDGPDQPEGAGTLHHLPCRSRV